MTDLTGKRPCALQQPSQTFTTQTRRQASADLLVVGVQPSDFVIAQLADLDARHINRAKGQGLELKKLAKFRFACALITDQIFDPYAPATRPI